MKGLKQTRLSFAPISQGDTPARSSQNPTSTTPPVPAELVEMTLRPKKAIQFTNGRTRGGALVCVEIPPPPKRNSRAQNALRVSKRTSPVKASPKASTTTPAQNRRPSHKRKLSPDPSPYAMGPEETVNVELLSSKPRTARLSSPSKKLRFSSPESDLTPLPSTSGLDTDSDELVPTSQSDEQELTLPRGLDRDPAVVKECVAKWRQETDANPPSRAQSLLPFDSNNLASDDTLMEVDALLYISETPDKLATGASQYLRMHRPFNGSPPPEHAETDEVAVTRPVTHATLALPVDPLTCTSPIPGVSPSVFSSLSLPSPNNSSLEPEEELQIVQALDVKSKTEQLIANIKARALAAAHSSPEQSPVDLDDLSDSDSDSDDATGLAAMLTKSVKGKGKAEISDSHSEGGSSKTEAAAIPRYNLRHLSPKTRKAPAPLFMQQRKTSKASPLDALLREKAREERTGTGMIAIRSAAAAFAAAKERERDGSRKGLRDEIDDEEESEDDDDWRAAIGLIGAAASESSWKPRASRPNATKAQSVDPDTSGSEGNGEFDSDPVMGSKSVYAVGDILEKDMRDEKARALATLTAEPVGVPLWVANSVPGDVVDDMDVDCPLSSFDPPEVEANAMLQLLRDATRSNDATQVSALLASGFVTLLRPEQYASVVPWLFDLVFSDVHPTMSRLAYTQLMRLGPLLGPHASGLQPSSVHSALVRLGASRSMLVEKYGWDVTSTQVSGYVATLEYRDEMVYRLVTLLGALANAPMAEGLRDFFLATLLVGQDPTTSEDLLVEVHTTCESIARSIEIAQGDSFDLETSLSEMVVAFGKTLSPINQARLISLFPCVSSSTTRMARNIARILLIDGPSILRSYEKLPNLSPVVDLLTPPVGSGAYFDVMGNADKDGYHDDLTCRVSLLGRVLSDIDEYTLLEVQAAKEKAASGKERLALVGEEKAEDKENDEEPPSIIEQVRTQLELLHGRIVDTRAAHLDRSRAKAAIQGLNLRVHYQRVATLKSSSRTGKPRTLRAYFPDPS
ncbi:hypothetical protein BC628DRAFT_1358852 [Trametes gibbosa]|nr:hypothetical protein BC628DRAFT_1358852 [Trametes gibbosa]